MNARVASLVKAKDIVFGRTFELSLVKTYVSHWGLAHAVRELIQNALDSESPFIYEFIDEGDGKVALRLNSEFTTLSPATLLLGATSKADSDEAIGSFGEGYKIALLVLTRMGYDVDMLNGDLVWRPRFRFNRAFGEEILCIDETFAPDRTNKGLTFVVHGLDANDSAAIVASCLMMQDSIGQIKRTSLGDILLDQPGKLYVGHLFICETELRYGYNIKPRWLRLERDRQTVSSFDLKDITLKCWYETGEYTRIAEMIADDVPDVAYAEYGAPEMVKEECYRLFRVAHPGAVVAANQAEMKELVERGMTKVVVLHGSMHYAVKTSRAYRHEIPTKAVVAPHVALHAFLHAHRDEMRTKAIVAFKQLIADAEKNWTNK